MIFFLPVFAIAFTNLGSSQEFIDERSIGSWPGKTALSWSHILPLKDLNSTVVNTTGTSKIRVACQGNGAVDDGLTIEIRGSEEHLWLVVDERDDAVVRRQQTAVLRQDYPSFPKRGLGTNRCCLRRAESLRVTRDMGAIELLSAWGCADKERGKRALVGSGLSD